MTLSFKHLVTASSGATEIAGTGLRVYSILGFYEMGESAESIAENYDVPIAAIFECLAYAEEHPEEMETVRANEDAIEREIIAALPDHLRPLAEESMEEDKRSLADLINKAREARLGTLVP